MKKIGITVYIILFFIAALLSNDIGQEYYLIIFSFISIFVMKQVFNIEDKMLNVSMVVLVAINIVCIYVSYYSAVKLGYSNGLIRGTIGKFSYFDTANYYEQSGVLGDFWRNGGFSYWLKGNMQKGNVFYSYYNFFVIWNTILRILFGNLVNSLILIKLQFTIANMFIIYKISKLYLKKFFSNISVIIFNLFPGYLLVNITLMRDNIILFFILIASYIFLKNIKILTKKIIIQLLFLLLIITYMRVYAGVALGVFFFVMYYLDKITLKKIVIGVLGGVAGIFAIGKIIQAMGYGFLGSNLLNNSVESLNRFNPERVATIPKLVFWSIYNMLLAGKMKIEYYGYIGNFLNSINNVCVACISIISVVSIILIAKKNMKEFKKLAISAYIYVFVSSLMITFIFTSIIPRLYIVWIWVQIILMLKLFEYKSEKESATAIIKAIIPIVICILGVYILA